KNGSSLLCARPTVLLAQHTAPSRQPPSYDRRAPMSSSHGRFVWYELTTTDPEAAKAFYGKVMGWGTRETSMPGARYTLFTVGNVSTGGLIKLPRDATMQGAAPPRVG